MAQYGGYDNQGGYGQPNPYAQRNPYAQQQQSQPAYGGQQAGQYGGQPNGYDGGDDMEMGAMNGRGRNADAILNETSDIDRGIDTIQQNLQQLRLLQQRALNDPDGSQNTQTNREIDALNTDTMTLYRNFGERLRKIKSQKESGDPRNKGQVGKVDRKLKAAIQEYQQVDRDYQRDLGQQLERQYRIVNPNATEQEVRAAVEDTSNNQIFEQALMNSNRRGQSQTVLRAVQGRHEAIQKIEQQMVELAQLFQQVDEYVVQQEAPLEQIDMAGERVQEDVGKANVQLDEANKQARSRNRKKWWCLLIAVIIVAIIVIVVAIVVVMNNKKK